MAEYGVMTRKAEKADFKKLSKSKKVGHLFTNYDYVFIKSTDETFSVFDWDNHKFTKLTDSQWPSGWYPAGRSFNDIIEFVFSKVFIDMSSWYS